MLNIQAPNPLPIFKNIEVEQQGGSWLLCGFRPQLEAVCFVAVSKTSVERALCGPWTLDLHHRRAVLGTPQHSLGALCAHPQ